MLKHKPHRSKLKVTATNSLPSITPRLRSSRGAPGTRQEQRTGSAEPHLLHSRRQGAAPLSRVAAPGAQPALTFPSIPGHNCNASGLATTQSAPSSHATSAHRPHCANKLGTDAEQTKNLGFISSGQPVYC